MIFDKLSLFANATAIPTTANKTYYTKCVDLRKCGQVGLDGLLKIWAGAMGAPNATGQVVTTLQTGDFSASGVLSFEDVASQTQVAGKNELMAMFLPYKNLKRFLRLKFAVGATALGSAITVKAGLVDQFDMTDLPATQKFPLNPSAGVNKGLEDLAALSDRVGETLAVAATAKTIAKGGNEDIGITAGVVANYTAPTGYTVTVSSDKVNVALASTAASGSVVLVDGTGKATTIAVTASS